MGGSPSWSYRAHQAFSVIAWCCAINAAWLLFTVLGGVVLGIGPATVTACVLTRRRMRGDQVRARDFASTWWRELSRGSAVVIPLLAVIIVLATNYLFFSALGPDLTAARLATLGALVLVAVAASYVGPMYAHYDLPLWAYPLRALRFGLARPVPTVILLLVGASIGAATVAAPVLAVTVSIGAWLHTSTWLCVRFFEQNEDRLAEEATPGPRSPVRMLPSEPLRIR